MKTNFLLLFFLLFLLPIVVILIYGSKSFNQSTKDLESDFSNTQKEATQEIKKNIDNAILHMQLILRNILNVANDEPVEILRNTLNWEKGSPEEPSNYSSKLQKISSPYIKQVFMVDQKGKLTYPLVAENKNQSELNFFEKTKPLWQNNHFLLHIENSNSDSQKTNESVRNNDFYRMQQQTQKAPEEIDGLYAYYWGSGLNLIYWKKLSNNDIVGADLNIAYIKAKLISQLPMQKKSKGLVQLLDDNQKIIHQWGNFAPLPKNSKTQYEYLNSPLKNWTIVNTEPPPESLGALKTSFQASLFTNLVVIGVLFILCGLIAYFFMMKEVKQIQKKMNFITEVSHELKTPLTNIRLYSELLERKLPPDDLKSKGYIQVLLQETQRLSRMIHNVLTFRKLSSKINDQKIWDVDVNQIANQCLSNFEPLLISKGFEIHRQFELSSKVLADHDSLEQILSNLISNVEKYAAEGKYICLHTYELNGFAFIDCIDKGVALSKQNAKLIFEPFYRAHKDLSHGAGGTGIGLTISRQLAKLNYGSLECIPSPTGNLFRIQLLLAKGKS